MNKFLICLALGVSLSGLMIVQAHATSEASVSSSNAHKKIPIIVVSCEGPHIGYFEYKGKQHCIALKSSTKKVS